MQFAPVNASIVLCGDGTSLQRPQEGDTSPWGGACTACGLGQYSDLSSQLQSTSVSRLSTQSALARVGQCRACSGNSYSDTPLATACTSCPGNSTMVHIERSAKESCHCNAGYYLAQNDKCTPCMPSLDPETLLTTREYHCVEIVNGTQVRPLVIHCRYWACSTPPPPRPHRELSARLSQFPPSLFAVAYYLCLFTCWQRLQRGWWLPAARMGSGGSGAASSGNSSVLAMFNEQPQMCHASSGCESSGECAAGM